MKDESRPALPTPVNGENANHLLPRPTFRFGKRALPDNLAVKCPNCRELLVGKDLEKNLQVCQRCDHHLRLTAEQRIELLLDEDSFVELAADLVSVDPLGFVSRSQSYRHKLEDERAKSGLTESLVAGTSDFFGAMYAQCG